AQRKAQNELDSVLGPCTTPRLTDRVRLPFTDAPISEVLRTYTIERVFHLLSAEDDSHSGLFIPKNAIIITNNWQV
ncbi:hypothetical protein B0H19DRAFT_930196, partial [Mycena capillaripes]